MIVDAIGVTKSLKTSSQPIITKLSVSLKDLAMGVMMGASDTDTVSSLAGRLARLNNQLDADEQQRVKTAAKGVVLSQFIGNRDSLTFFSIDLRMGLRLPTRNVRKYLLRIADNSRLQDLMHFFSSERIVFFTRDFCICQVCFFERVLYRKQAILRTKPQYFIGYKYHRGIIRIE